MGAVLAVALFTAAVPAPDPAPACPPGAEVRGAAPPDDTARWCEARDLYGTARKHGPSRTWYDDGGRWIEEAFVEGRREGLFTEYHRNGKKAREGRYAADERDGAWTTWYENGNVEETVTFRMGVRDGPFATFWRGGGRKAEGRYCGGAQCGRWRAWGEDGAEQGSIDYGVQRLVP